MELARRRVWARPHAAPASGPRFPVPRQLEHFHFVCRQVDGLFEFAFLMDAEQPERGGLLRNLRRKVAAEEL